MPSPQPAPAGPHVSESVSSSLATAARGAPLARLSPGETSGGTAQPVHRVVSSNKLLFYAIKFQGDLFQES